MRQTKTKSPGYTKIPNELLDRAMIELAPGPFAMLLRIVRLTHGWHRASRRLKLNTLAQQLQVSYKTARRYRRVLTDSGWLITSNGIPGSPLEYTPTIPGSPLVTHDQTPGHSSDQTPGHSCDQAYEEKKDSLHIESLKRARAADSVSDTSTPHAPEKVKAVMDEANEKRARLAAYVCLCWRRTGQPFTAAELRLCSDVEREYELRGYTWPQWAAMDTAFKAGESAGGSAGS